MKDTGPATRPRDSVDGAPDAPDAGRGTAERLRDAILRYARYSLGKEWTALTRREQWIAVSLAVREAIIDGLLATERAARASGAKRIYYLSMEFLAGRALGNNLLNLGLLEACREALAGIGADLDEVREVEPDPALGNGGLGRLAACYVDSMATLGLAGYGYGINYEFGLFRQVFRDGWQEEHPDVWRSPGTPWLIQRPDLAEPIPVYGRVEGRRGKRQPAQWVDTREIIGVPSDMPVVGYGGRTVNYLRLYSALASAEFDMEIFNAGDYVRALEQKIHSERISKVLYPSDDIPAGRELRLLQEYFFVACALRDVLARHGSPREELALLPERAAIQLNDTHPALAVAELMRVLVDEMQFPWDEALRITRGTIAYTNHTLMPEAQERWPVELLERVLPRHMQIVFDLNEQFLDAVERRWPGDVDRRRRMSLIDENGEKQVRMMHLAVVGSHSVNGVSQLHSRLLQREVLPDFHALWPERFTNVTNGVTQRRWLLNANPPLAALVTELVGERWILQLDALRDLERHAADRAVLDRLARIKRGHKEALAVQIRRLTDVVVDPASLFDVQVKRIHEYKRQLLNALRIVHDYLRLVEDGVAPPVPRTYVFGGKAAPGYVAAKRIIKLVNEIARVVNADPRAHDWMKVAYLPDYRVTLAERIIPAADVSEQISTAGMEASGTGNMKFMMNGALTVGTLDGANIEMLEEAGEENLFIFGLTAGQIDELRRTNAYDPKAHHQADTRVQRVVDALLHDRFSPDEPGLFRPVAEQLLAHDRFFVLADLPAFLDVQQQVGETFQTPAVWTERCLRNVARSGKFSSDRSIREYASKIWALR